MTRHLECEKESENIYFEFIITSFIENLDEDFDGSVFLHSILVRNYDD